VTLSPRTPQLSAFLFLLSSHFPPPGHTFFGVCFLFRYLSVSLSVGFVGFTLFLFGSFYFLGHGRLQARRPDALPPDRGQGQRVRQRRRARVHGRSHRAPREDVQQTGASKYSDRLPRLPCAPSPTSCLLFIPLAPAVPHCSFPCFEPGDA